MTSSAYATESDFEFCRQIHRKFGTTYYFATRRFSPKQAKKVHALYAFVRIPDEWVDNPGDLSPSEVRQLLSDWRRQYRQGLQGRVPEHPAMRAFCDVAQECRISQSEAECFLDAMEQDLSTCRYQTFEDLRGYMRGSAAAVGIMMCSVMGATIDDDLLKSASTLGEAMQLANFIRDVGEDASRGRIYLPIEDLVAFEVSEDDLMEGRLTESVQNLMRFQIERARSLFEASDEGIARLPREAQIPVLLARILYAQILDRVELNGYDVFSKRARTSLSTKLYQAVKVMVLREKVLKRLHPSGGKRRKRSALYSAMRRLTQDLF